MRIELDSGHPVDFSGLEPDLPCLQQQDVRVWIRLGGERGGFVELQQAEDNRMSSIGCIECVGLGIHRQDGVEVSNARFGTLVS